MKSGGEKSLTSEMKDKIPEFKGVKSFKRVMKDKIYKIRWHNVLQNDQSIKLLDYFFAILILVREDFEGYPI
jgi:hypothetical protein